MNLAIDDSRAITIEGDRYHLGWLRYCCLCPECRHPDSFQKTVELSDRDIPVALSVDLRTTDGVLEVEWQEDPAHRSVYPLDWLRAHRWNGQPTTEARAEGLWDAKSVQDRIRWHDARSCEGVDGPWIHDLYDNGFTLLQNVTPAELERILSEFEPVHYTEYGRYATVKANPDAEDLSETAYPLTPHTDYPYKQTTPLIQFCYFAENKASGGEFFLVDGQKVADDFKSTHPDLFDLLSQTPVEFEQLYTTWRYLYRIQRPIIQLDATGNAEAIYFGHSHCWTWQVPPNQSEDYYVAYHTFLKFLNDERYRWEHRFQDGECVAFRNSRVLHGRNSFDPRSGLRHLITTYLPWEQLEARIRFQRESPYYLPR
jgi:alpha-ketoglutarate-dependent taurine dioxygenase